MFFLATTVRIWLLDRYYLSIKVKPIVRVKELDNFRVD